MVQVKKSESKAWEQRLRLRGKQIELGLGNYNAVILVEARSIAHNYKLLASKGIDPRRARKSKNGSKTF